MFKQIAYIYVEADNPKNTSQAHKIIPITFDDIIKKLDVGSPFNMRTSPTTNQPVANFDPVTNFDFLLPQNFFLRQLWRFLDFVAGWFNR